jgi:hypothetical protein
MKVKIIKKIIEKIIKIFFFSIIKNIENSDIKKNKKDVRSPEKNIATPTKNIVAKLINILNDFSLKKNK